MPFGCSICKKSFAKAASLSKHVEIHHSRKEPKTTLKQPKVIKNTKTIQADVEKETKPNEIKEFDKIQKVYEAEKHKDNAKEHYNENCTPKNSNQSVSKEMEEKENHSDKTVHQKIWHNFEPKDWRTKQPGKVTPLKCSICNLTFHSFQSKFDLMRHIANVHERKNPIKENIEFQGPNQFKCKICDAKFFAIGGMNQHMSKIHKVESTFNFKCNICGEVYKNNTDLKIHNEAVHEQKKPFSSIGNANNLELQEHLKPITEINEGWFKRGHFSSLPVKIIQQTNQPINGRNTNRYVKEKPIQTISKLKENCQEKDGRKIKNNRQQLSINPDLLHFDSKNIEFKNDNSYDSFNEDCAMDLTFSMNSTFLGEMTEKYPTSTMQELLNLENIVKRVKEKFPSSKTFQNSNSEVNTNLGAMVKKEEVNETVCEVKENNVNQSSVQVDFRNSIYEIPTLVDNIKQKKSLPFEMDIDVENIIKRVQEKFSNSKAYQNSNLELNVANLRAMVQKDEINENVFEVKKIKDKQSIIQMVLM